MKLHLQIVNVEDSDGWGAATTTIPLSKEDLALPLDEFVERYLKPAFVNTKQIHESLRERHEANA